MLSPEGNNQDEYKKLVQCGRTMSCNISASKLQCHEVLVAYQTMLQPAMKYLLCSSTFTFQQCPQIDRSYMPTLLTRTGFNKITKRLLFYGPPNLGAFGFTDTYTDQGIAHLQMFLGQLRHDNELAQLMHMHILLEKVQLQMGIPENLSFPAI